MLVHADRARIRQFRRFWPVFGSRPGRPGSDRDFRRVRLRHRRRGVGGLRAGQPALCRRAALGALARGRLHVLGVPAQAEARGYVRIRSPDPLEPPAMQPNYLSSPADRRMIVLGIRLARRLAETKALAPYVRREYRPGPQAASDEDLLEFAKNTGATIVHPSGTCRMGRDPLAVVDARLRVHGSKRCAWSMRASCRGSSRATRTCP